MRRKLQLMQRRELFLEVAMERQATKSWANEALTAHASYKAWTDVPSPGAGDVTMSNTISILREKLPSDAILTNGAGNYAIWLHRFYRYKWGTQLAPTSGSMGYGMPAAIAAAKRNPEKTIVVLAGDGCFQMHGMEFGVACEHNLNIKVLVCDNSVYGTIKMHQERDYPGRVSGTDMKNPDFAAWARSYGAVGLSVEKDADFEKSLDGVLAENGPALIHLKLDASDIAPGKVLNL